MINLTKLLEEDAKLPQRVPIEMIERIKRDETVQKKCWNCGEIYDETMITELGKMQIPVCIYCLKLN